MFRSPSKPFGIGKRGGQWIVMAWTGLAALLGEVLPSTWIHGGPGIVSSDVELLPSEFEGCKSSKLTKVIPQRSHIHSTMKFFIIRPVLVIYETSLESFGKGDMSKIKQ